MSTETKLETPIDHSAQGVVVHRNGSACCGAQRSINFVKENRHRHPAYFTALCEICNDTQRWNATPREIEEQNK